MKSFITNIYRYLFKFREQIRFKKLVKAININDTVQLQFDIDVSTPNNLTISDYVYIGSNAKIQALGKVNIKRGVIIGSDLRLYSANHRFKGAESIPYDNIYIKKPVTIEENVWIGSRVTIVPGTVIGEGAVVGAGAVVSGKIPKLSIVIGNPAKIIGNRDEKEYNKLKLEDKIYLKLKQEPKNSR